MENTNLPSASGPPSKDVYEAAKILLQLQRSPSKRNVYAPVPSGSRDLNPIVDKYLETNIKYIETSKDSTKSTTSTSSEADSDEKCTLDIREVMSSSPVSSSEIISNSSDEDAQMSREDIKFETDVESSMIERSKRSDSSEEISPEQVRELSNIRRPISPKISSLNPNTQHKTTFCIACKACGKIFSSKSDFKKHRSKKGQLAKAIFESSETPGTMENEKPPIHKLILKNALTSDKGKFQTLITKHKFTQVFSCDFCRALFDRPWNCSRHMSLHAPKTPLSCSLYKTLQSGRHRVARCRVRQPVRKNAHVCKVCNKRYATIGILNNHALSHAKLRMKIFTCELCKRIFKKKWNLKMHKYLHKSEKPYECEVCNKSFVHSAYLRSHKRDHH